MKTKLKLLLISSLFFIAMIAKAQTDTTWHVNGLDSIKTDNHAQIGNGLKVIGHLVADSIKVKSLHVGDSSLIFSTIGGVDMIQTNSSTAEISIGTSAPPNSGIFSWVEVGLGIHHPTHMLHVNDSQYFFPARPVNMAFTGYGNGWGTGTTAKDGFQIGLNAGKVAELNQQENLDMLFYTGNNNPAGTVLNTERMRIIGRTGAWQGNVAIGTSSPDSSALLHVSATNKGLLIPNVALTSTSDASTVPTPAHSLLVYNTGGGLSPTGYYYNAGTSTAPNWVRFGTSNGWHLNGNNSTTASTAAIGSAVNNNFIGTTDNKDWVMATNNLERARIKANGNMGLNITNPDEKLQIFEGNIRLSYNYNVHWGTATTGPKAFIGTYSAAPYRGIRYSSKAEATGWHGVHDFYTQAGATDNDPSILTMRVMDNGVAVFATNPDIYSISGSSDKIIGISASSASAFAIINLAGGSGASGGINFGNQTIRQAAILSRDGSHLSFSTNSSNSGTSTPEKMRITSAGNVGIGTTSPTHQLQLSNDDGAKPSTGTWTIVSDARLKNIDSAYTKGIKEILQLNPILYHYKNVDSTVTFTNKVLNTQNCGFIAQDVQQIFPEAIKVDTLGYLNLNIHPILIAFVNAFKEQQATIDSLKQNQKTTDSLMSNQKAKDSLLTSTINNMLIHQQTTDNTMNQQRQADSLLTETVNSLMATVTNCCSQYSNPKMMLNNSSSGQTPCETLQVELANNNQTILFQNQPNPFSESTVIRYFIPENITGSAFVVFYDVYGQEIKRTEIFTKGFGNINVNAENLLSGVYSYSLLIDGKVIDTKKMIKNK